MTIGTTGYTTLSRPFALDLSDLPAGVTAYYASAVGASWVTLTETTAKVAAGTGLILKGTPGANYTIPVAKQSEAETLSGNLLVGCTVRQSVATDENKYVMVNNGGTAEFQNLSTSPATVPAGKAFLSVPVLGGGAKARLSFFFESSDATAIETIPAADALNDAPAYNLQGQRVDKAYKGIIIQKGKKYLAK